MKESRKNGVKIKGQFIQLALINLQKKLNIEKLYHIFI